MSSVHNIYMNLFSCILNMYIKLYVCGILMDRGWDCLMTIFFLITASTFSFYFWQSTPSVCIWLPSWHHSTERQIKMASKVSLCPWCTSNYRSGNLVAPFGKETLIFTEHADSQFVASFTNVVSYLIKSKSYYPIMWYYVFRAVQCQQLQMTNKHIKMKQSTRDITGYPQQNYDVGYIMTNITVKLIFISPILKLCVHSRCHILM